MGLIRTGEFGMLYTIPENKESENFITASLPLTVHMRPQDQITQLELLDGCLKIHFGETVLTVKHDNSRCFIDFVRTENE